MFDNKKYRETQSELKNIHNNLEELEKIRNNIFKELYTLENKCDHNLLLVYDVKYYLNNTSSTMRQGNCLCCNKEFILYHELSLDNKNAEMVYKKVEDGKLTIIDKENIIDVTDVVSKINWGTKLFLDAKEVLNNLEIDNMDTEEIKKLIYNSIVLKYQNNDTLKKVYKRD